ncbi:MAG TPA: NAD regulator [Hyphomicrobiaceae bacterium]
MASPLPGPMPRTAPRSLPPGEAVAVALSAAILAVRAGEPVVAVVPAQRPDEESLPSGPFHPRAHRTLESAVATWAQAQTGVEVGFLQQLCTLADCAGMEPAPPTLSVSYLALVGPRQCSDRTPARWRSWYAFFPWEDWRYGRPERLVDICGRLEAWADQDEPPCVTAPPSDRQQRVRMAFGAAGAGWDEEKVLDRYALLREAGIIEHATSDGAAPRTPRLVHPLLGDQGALLARAIGELRRAVKSRPLVFELMPEEFTLFELQKTVEAVLGPHLHKQNFRRMVEGGGLVEPTGEHRLRTGGRPARLYRFRRDVVWERSAPGVRVKAGRA